MGRPLFTGMFWDSPDKSVERGEREPDDNVLITLDAPATSAEEVVPYLVALRSRVQLAYASDEQEQKVLWITMQPLQILS